VPAPTLEGTGGISMTTEQNVGAALHPLLMKVWNSITVAEAVGQPAT
jgi:hypothetical protein